MKIEIDVPTYDAQRYGKPFIAQMSFKDPKGTPRWGDYLGYDGEPGLLVLPDVYPGDVIMRGQRDNETDHSIPEFFVLLEDGELRNLSKVDAYRHYNARRKAIADGAAAGRDV